MRGITATLLIGAALTTAGTATYEACTPQGAAWFYEGKMVPVTEQADLEVETGIIKQHTNHGQMEAPKYTREAYVDFQGTGPPQLDDYPKSPEEAASRASQTNTKSASQIANFGIYKD